MQLWVALLNASYGKNWKRKFFLRQVYWEYLFLGITETEEIDKN